MSLLDGSWLAEDPLQTLGAKGGCRGSHSEIGEPCGFRPQDCARSQGNQALANAPEKHSFRTQSHHRERVCAEPTLIV